ncbi:hypothetical protein AXF42_Ash016630 [Apostasia shenzhenica]|uniref:Uncharacterized protein n=1 Tax=Apostasia shenzhenica TaxID=1088818 RepID=A0A2I0A1L8_9ASPA|nr:hypothetical protein AXF42_Ash016630 [Apostasia shenzhenica]
MGVALYRAITLQFKVTNNQTKYEVLIVGLKFALGMSVKHIQVFNDSQLVVNQANRAYEIMDEVLKKYLVKAHSLISQFDEFFLTHVPREDNQVADHLAKSSEHTPRWMDKIINYLKNGAQPSNQQEAKRLRLKCAKYTLISEELYRRFYVWLLTKCLRPEEAQEVMEAVHKGECGTHARGQSLVLRILRQGFFWPNIHKDDQTFVKKCPQCQYYADMQRQPVGYFKPINSSWPFAVWGLDFLGAMPTAICSYKWLLVTVDYFRYWIEAKPLAQLTA